MQFNKKKIFELFETEEESISLDNDVEIEDLLVFIKGLDDKIAFLGRLKKDRTATITDEIDKLKDKKDQLKDIIKNTLVKFKHKSLNFPGVGRVNKKISKGKWVIDDEKALLAELEDKLSEDEFKDVVVEKPSIVKKELDRILGEWDSQDSVPECVKKGDDSTSLTVSFDKKIAEKIDQIEDLDINEVDTEVSEIDYDVLEF